MTVERKDKWMVAKSSNNVVVLKDHTNVSDYKESGDLNEEILKLRRILKEKDEEIAKLGIALKNVNDCRPRCDSRLSPNNLLKMKHSNDNESIIGRTSNTTSIEDVVTTSIDINVIYSGEGPSPSDGSTVKIHYTISLEREENKIIETSRERNNGSPFEFVLGKEGSIIKGWNIALKRMKRGEMSMVKIPSQYGYGAHGLPPIIPEDAALICRIELIDFWKYEVPFRPWVVCLNSVGM